MSQQNSVPQRSDRETSLDGLGKLLVVSLGSIVLALGVIAVVII